MFKVVKLFTDGQDSGRLYNVGDTYPREGLKPSKDRIAELSSENNKRGEILIKEIKTAEKKPEAPKKATKKAKK